MMQLLLAIGLVPDFGDALHNIRAAPARSPVQHGSIHSVQHNYGTVKAFVVQIFTFYSWDLVRNCDGWAWAVRGLTNFVPAGALGSSGTE
jgi:hypothetical protein